MTLPEAFPSAGDSRAQAERLFRRALALDPALAEARIRLAHVVGDSGRHEAAATELERAARQPLPPLLDYYASLLTGREARARGQLDAARRGFERAAGIYPNAPAPKYGLSELAIARNNGPESLAHLLPSEAAARSDPNEPWWWIDRVHDPSAQTLIGRASRAGDAMTRRQAAGLHLLVSLSVAVLFQGGADARPPLQQPTFTSRIETVRRRRVRPPGS